MEQLENMSFKDLDQMVNDVADKFFYAKKIRCLNYGNVIGESSFNEENPFDSFCLKVERAYESLNELERNLINNEFFYQSYNRWWETLYSKASFYRYKKEAMQKFLGAIYDS